MNCLTNVCYVCLEKKDKSLININSSLSVNNDIIHIIGYTSFNLGWMKTKQITLICEECCRRLRETYQFLIMCHKNSAVLQGYMAKINTANILDADNEVEERVDLCNKQDDINKIICEIKSEDGEIYTVGEEPVIKDAECEFINVEDSFVKEEDNWKMEEVDDKEESPKDNNCTESSNDETALEISVNRHDTNADSDSSGFTSTQVHTTKKKQPNTAAKQSHKCLTCSKSFSTNLNLQIHTRVHTGEKPYKCGICNKCFNQEVNLKSHMRAHTGEKPYECSRCKKCFRIGSYLVTHMRTHTGEKPYECSRCKRCFSQQSSLLCHMRIHTGEKPYECSKCKKCFNRQGTLVRHMRVHTGEEF